MSQIDANSYGMPRDDEIRLAMGELTTDQMRTAKAAIRWALTRKCFPGPSRETLHDALVLIDSWIKRGDLDPNDNGTAKNSERNGMVIAYNLVHALWRGDEIEYGPHRDEYSPPATPSEGK